MISFICKIKQNLQEMRSDLWLLEHEVRGGGTE